MPNRDGEVERLIERAKYWQREQAIGDDAPRRQLELHPSLEDNYAWVLRKTAREIAEQLRDGETATLDRAAAALVCEGLEVAASRSEGASEIKEIRLRMARAERAFFERDRDSKQRLSNMARSLGFLRADGKRGRTIDRTLAAQAYDALTLHGPGMIVFEDDLSWRSGERSEITNPRAINVADFSIREFGDARRPSWLVTGCPVTPAQALEAIQQAFGFASVATVHRALEAERAEVRRIRDRLKSYRDVPEVRTYLDALPEIKHLGRRPEPRSNRKTTHKTTSTPSAT